MTPVWANACDQALELLERATVEVEQAAADAAGGVNAAWSWLVGSSSSVDALRSDAIASRNLLEAMRAKRSRITGDDEAEQFVRDCGAYADVSGTLATAHELSAAGGVSDVVGATVQDIGTGIKAGLELVPWLAILALVVLLMRRGD